MALSQKSVVINMSSFYSQTLAYVSLHHCMYIPSVTSGHAHVHCIQSKYSALSMSHVSLLIEVIFGQLVLQEIVKDLRKLSCMYLPR